MAVTPERMQEIRLDLLNLIEVYKEMNRLRDEVLPKIHQRYLTLYSTIEDKVSNMLHQYGELCQDALQPSAKTLIATGWTFGWVSRPRFSAVSPLSLMR